jgi:diacylglycerol O-acyltransferase / wax synthase
MRLLSQVSLTIMRKLSLLDLGFFIAETEASPKHVGGLLVFKRPANSRETFAHDLYTDLLTFTDVVAPFNLVINFTMTAMPSWRSADTVDLTQHIFYHRLPKPKKPAKRAKPAEDTKTDQQMLFDVVAKLHEPMLDRTRPLWEVHVIDGLPDGRFALYQKMHHAYADGVTMVRWTEEGLAKTARSKKITPIWTIKQSAYSGLRKKRTEALMASGWSSLGGTTRRVLGISRLATMLALESVKLTKNAIALPFITTAKTPLTGQVSSGRQFASAGVSMARMEAIRKRTRSTLNHIALTCVDGALRRYLSDQGVELNQPIIIQMPVNLRREGEKTAGNKIGIILVELSPPTDDPYIRLRNIGFSLRNVRTMIDNVAPEAIESYTIITGLIAQIAEMLKLSDNMPPMGNTLVSNVAGPKEHLYMRGAKMEEMHPISTLPPSNLLNVTLFSYAGDLFFGLIASDVLPNLPRLAHYVEEAFGELELSVGAMSAQT